MSKYAQWAIVLYPSYLLRALAPAKKVAHSKEQASPLEPLIFRSYQYVRCAFGTVALLAATLITLSIITDPQTSF